MSESTRWENWNCDQVAIGLRQKRRIFGERHFGNVPFSKLRESIKNFLNWSTFGDDKFYTLDLDSTRKQVANMVVIAYGDAQS
jgi:hypothetical protein